MEKNIENNKKYLLFNIIVVAVYVISQVIFSLIKYPTDISRFIHCINERIYDAAIRVALRLLGILLSILLVCIGNQRMWKVIASGIIVLITVVLIVVGGYFFFHVQMCGVYLILILNVAYIIRFIFKQPRTPTKQQQIDDLQKQIDELKK